MATSLRERRRQMLHDDILHSVGELLAEKGYASMSMDELAARVGVSKPTLYSFFPTKEDLLVAVVMHGFDRLSAYLQADLTSRSPLQQLSFILRTVIQLQVNKGALTPRPWSPELIQVLCSRQEVLERMRANEASILSLVREGISNGEIHAALDPLLIVRSFFAMLNALHMPFFGDLGACNPETVGQVLATIFERGVRAPES